MMIEPDNQLSLVRQCQLLDLSRSNYYYRWQPIDDDHLVLSRKMDEQYLKTPQYGARSYAAWFQRQGHSSWPEKIHLHDEDAGYHQQAPKPRTSIPGKHPYGLSLSA